MGNRGLAEFLRSRRARLRPGDVGVVEGTGRRRAVGLRREEVAVLAGVSIDYYTRLEQGRDTHPGPTVVAGLARALRLDEEERAHLEDLAARPMGVPSSAASTTARPLSGLATLLDALRPAPGWVLDPTSTVLAANPEGWSLLWGIEAWPAPRRNVLRYVFTHPSARAVFLSWSDVARECVADLRAVAAGPHADAAGELVRELTAASSEFARLWQAYDVRVNAGGRRVFDHPRVGRLELTTEILTDRHGRRVVVFQADAAGDSRQALRLLSSES